MKSSKDPESAIRFVENEGSLILSVLASQTHIDTEKLDIDAFVANGVWEQVKSAIHNYDELFSDMEKIQKIESSESKLNRILDKIEILLNSVSNMDFSEEGIKNMSKTLSEQLGKLEEVFPQIKQNPSESETVTP